MKLLIIMEGSSNGSECASTPEQSQEIVHNFVGESCMYKLMYVCVFNFVAFD